MKTTPEKLADVANQLFREFNYKNILISRIENLSHACLEHSSLEKSKLETLIEDHNYEEAINKLESIIESLDGGYCKILDIIEGNEEEIYK